MMTRQHVYLLAALVLVLIVSSCGGGSVNPNATPNPITPTVEEPTNKDLSILPVKMQPQEPIEPPVKGISWIDVEPLQSLDSVVGKTVSGEEQLRKDGAGFDNLLPLNRVTATSLIKAEFTPNWTIENPAPENLAYAIYRFDLTGITPPEDTVSMGWDTAPILLDEAYIGLGNPSASCWDWYQLDSDGVVSVGDITTYISPENELMLMVVVTGTNSCVLSEVSLGEQEVRAAGVIGELPENPEYPNLFHDSLPTSIDLAPGCSPISDQGIMPASPAFALVDGAYNYDLKNIYGAYGWDFASDFNLTSPRYLFVEAGYSKGLSCQQGRTIQSCLSELSISGCATEQNAPWGNPPESGWCSQNWSQDAVDDAALLEIFRCTSIDPSGADGIEDVKTILVNQQKPLILQLGIDNDFLDYIQGEVWTYNGPVLGYHALVIVGYDDTVGNNGAFKVRNSWSDAWGDNGYIWIGYESFILPAPEMLLWCWTINDEYSHDAALRFCGQGATLAPPLWLLASDGEYSDRIEVTWHPHDGATGYRIYRDTQSNMVADVTTTTWDDTTITDELAHTYWVSAYDGSEESALSAPNTGYLAQIPSVLNMYPTEGESGSTVYFTPTVIGEAPLTYSWHFGGGATPNTSTDPNPCVQLGAVGSYNASLTLSNTHGSDTCNFTLSVNEPAYIPSADKLIAVPDKNEVEVNEEVLVQVSTGIPASPFQYLVSTRLVVDGEVEYVRNSLDFGVPDSDPYPARPVDGIWTAMSDNPNFDFIVPPDSLFSFEETVDGYAIDFAVVPLSGKDITGVGGGLYNFKMTFPQPGTYNISFVETQGYCRTLYRDQSSNDYTWGDISNIDPEFSRTITVTSSQGSELVTLPSDSEIDSSNDYLWIYHPDPSIRTNPNVQLTGGLFLPEDPTAYNDIIKTSGDEFIPVVCNSEVFPKVIVIEGTSPDGITSTTSGIAGVNLIERKPSYLTMDIAVITPFPAPGDPAKHYAFKVFGADEQQANWPVIGGGTFTVSPLPVSPPITTGENFGINAFSSTSRGNLLLGERSYMVKTLDGSTMSTLVPDVLFVEYYGGKDCDYTGSNNTVVHFVDTSDASSMDIPLSIRIVSLGTAGANRIGIHCFEDLDFTNPGQVIWPGILTPGNTYTVSLDSPYYPGIDYTFGDVLTVTGTNPNI